MLNKYFSLLKKKRQNSKWEQSLWNVQWLSQLWKRFQQSQVPEENLSVFQEGHTSSVTSVVSPYTWATSFLTERSNCKWSSLQTLKQPVLTNSLPQQRKEPVNLLCAQQGKVFHRSLAHYHCHPFTATSYSKTKLTACSAFSLGNANNWQDPKPTPWVQVSTL